MLFLGLFLDKEKKKATVSSDTTFQFMLMTTQK